MPAPTPCARHRRPKIVATRDLLGEVVANGVMNDASLPSRRPPIQTHEVHLRQVEVMPDESVCGGGRRPGERHSTALASNGSASQGKCCSVSLHSSYAVRSA